MKNFKIVVWLLCSIGVCTTASSNAQSTAVESSYHYAIDDQKLYDTIVALDSIFFGAYNTCNVNLEKYGAFYADSIEFYHDKGGLMTSKQDIIDATQRNICGKVTRELVKGSIEVYPIPNYGAIEMGLHKFHNNMEKSTAPSRIGRFTVIWQYKNKEWKIAKVISLHWNEIILSDKNTRLS